MKITNDGMSKTSCRRDNVSAVGTQSCEKNKINLIPKSNVTDLFV